MRVILLQDVENLGRRDEVKNVSDGFARNSLLPQKLVKIASKGALKELEAQKLIKENQATKDLKTTEKLVAALDGYELIIKEKADDGGKLYASLTPTKIAKALKEAGFDVSKNNIKSEAVKELGEYKIILEFEHNLEAEIKIIIELK